MRPRLDAAPDPHTTAYMGHDLGAPFHLSFAIRTLRAEYRSQPPDKQRETMERVRGLVAAHPSSYLARHWREIYVQERW